MRWVVVALAAWAGTAAATEVVRYDVEAFCRGASGVGNSFSHVVYRGCVEGEQAAFSRIGPRWNAAPEVTKNFCAGAAGGAGARQGVGSYVVLEGCLEAERRAAAQSPPTFRR